MNNSIHIFLLKIFTCVFLLSSCKSKPTKKLRSLNEDSAIKISTPSYSLEKIDTIPIYSKKQIIGTWIDLGKEVLTVDINDNTFFYREHHQKYKYQFTRDSIKIFFGDVVIYGKPNFVGDTLLISASNNNAYKFIKFNVKKY